MLNGTRIDGSVVENSSKTVTKRVRRVAGKPLVDGATDLSRVEPSHLLREQKWSAGGSWPIRSVAIDLAEGEIIGDGHHSRSSTFESNDLNSTGFRLSGHVVAIDVANLLAAGSGEKKQTDQKGISEKVIAIGRTVEKLIYYMKLLENF